jgi:hypothetical protein
MLNSTHITRWLAADDLAVNQVAQHYWQIPLSHLHARYVLHIRLSTGWLHYGADIFTFAHPSSANEKLLAQFYQFVLELNSKINGAQIAVESGKVVLIRNEISSDINEKTLRRSIELFHQTHEYVFSILLREAGKLGIRLSND